MNKLFSELRRKLREEGIEKVLTSKVEDLSKQIAEVNLGGNYILTLEDQTIILECILNFIKGIDRFNDEGVFMFLELPVADVEYHANQNSWGCFKSAKYGAYIHVFQVILGDFGTISTGQKCSMENKDKDKKKEVGVDENGKRLPQDHWILILKSERGRPSIMDFNPHCGTCVDEHDAHCVDKNLVK